MSQNEFRIILIQLLMFQYLIFNESFSKTVQTLWGVFVIIASIIHIFGLYPKGE